MCEVTKQGFLYLFDTHATICKHICICTDAHLCYELTLYICMPESYFCFCFCTFQNLGPSCTITKCLQNDHIGHDKLLEQTNYVDSFFSHLPHITSSDCFALHDGAFLQFLWCCTPQAAVDLNSFPYPLSTFRRLKNIRYCCEVMECGDSKKNKNECTQIAAWIVFKTHLVFKFGRSTRLHLSKKGHAQDTQSFRFTYFKSSPKIILIMPPIIRCTLSKRGLCSWRCLQIIKANVWGEIVVRQIRLL